VPYLKKYARFEDECDQCSKFFKLFSIWSELTIDTATDWDSGNGFYHIDLWTGSSTVNGGNDQIQCEDDLTPDPQSIVRNPATNYAVDSTLSF
jgi:hypothetical protein